MAGLSGVSGLCGLRADLLASCAWWWLAWRSSTLASATQRFVAGLLADDPAIKELCAVANPLLAMTRMKVQWPDVIVRDIEMSRIDGITILKLSAQMSRAAGAVERSVVLSAIGREIWPPLSGAAGAPKAVN